MQILLDGVSNKTIGLSLVSRPDIPTPEQVVEYINVDGRHGSLTKKGAYKDIVIPMEFSFAGIQATVKQILREVNRWTLNKDTLIFSDDTEFYYNLKNIVVKSTVNDIDIYGRVAIDFVCSPFQYQITEPIILTSSGVVFSPATIESEPLLTVFGTGNVEININDQAFKLTNLSDYITIDSGLKEAHRDGVPMNSNMVGKFPLFQTGENNISFTGNITKLEIEPRWRYL